MLTRKPQRSHSSAVLRVEALRVRWCCRRRLRDVCGRRGWSRFALRRSGQRDIPNHPTFDPPNWGGLVCTAVCTEQCEARGLRDLGRVQLEYSTRGGLGPKVVHTSYARHLHRATDTRYFRAGGERPYDSVHDGFADKRCTGLRRGRPQLAFDGGTPITKRANCQGIVTPTTRLKCEGALMVAHTHCTTRVKGCLNITSTRNSAQYL